MKHVNRNYRKIEIVLFLTGALGMWGCATLDKPNKVLSVSGVYPHLAMYNNEGECGTGALVPWAGKLWAITYGPHLPFGSSDKLYEIDGKLKQVVRPESIGGTTANRLVHKESEQLFIGPYAISIQGKVRVIPYSAMPGRITGTARHLTDPVNKIYHGTMEEGFYEVDVNSLDVNWLYSDTNVKRANRKNIPTADLPGYHGKGLYSGQGVLIYSNNGEYGDKALKQFDTPSGSLSEWNGKEWKVIRRNQFVEVTGPGGINGNTNPNTDPIWATGWDHKSTLLGVRSGVDWTFYRLPRASRSYDGAHGWNTEWPRIRNVGKGKKMNYLMTMHGMFWSFPGSFTAKKAKGIRPKSAYLKVIGDFTRWGDKLVFGTDDSAEKEFLNKRKAKGEIEGPGQSNSNLWFVNDNILDELGPDAAEGAIWQKEEVKKNVYSDPMLFAGWKQRSVWIHNNSEKSVILTAEIDINGKGEWEQLYEQTVGAGKSLNRVFLEDQKGEWIRVKINKDANMSVHFTYNNGDKRTEISSVIFDGLSTEASRNGGLLYSLGDNRRTMGVLAYELENNGIKKELGYYELNEKMELLPKEDEEIASLLESKFSIPSNVVKVEKSSVLVEDDNGRRWRLPLGDDSFTELTNNSTLRICREVATERDLFNCHGTFYELPAENADGYAKIRPLSSHNLKIHDYASFRGMLIMTGIDLEKASKNSKHIFTSTDKKAAIWAGVIDDLWQLGKPSGKGGPWFDSAVKRGVASDPYLIGFYDKKLLVLSHDALQPVSFRMEVDPGGDDNWMEYKVLTVKAGEKLSFEFPEGFQARWIRFVADHDCKATTMLTYM